MKKQLVLSYLLSGCLLLGSAAGVMVVCLFHPQHRQLLLGLLALLAVSVVLVLYITCRHLLMPLIRLEQRTSDILTSLGYENDCDESSPLLDRFQALIDREYKTRTSFRQAELDALQSQINPHFLYNTLECIRGQAIVEGNRSIADMARSLSEFFRYSISRKNALVTVSDELRNAFAYIKIQNYRFGEKYEVRIQVEEAERHDIYQCLLPRLTLQPIIENALLHGLRDSVRDKEYLDISLKLTDARLILSVTDYGTGMSQQQLDQLNLAMCRGSRDADAGFLEGRRSHSGVALPNINERIQLLFGPEYGLRIYSTPSVGSTVEIVLPVRKAAAGGGEAKTIRMAGGSLSPNL